MRLFLIVLFCLFSVAAPAQEVTDVRIGRDGNNTRFVLDITKSVPYRAFVLNNPPRVVIDLPKLAWSAPMNKGDAANRIKSYRKGIYSNDTMRVVLDLNTPMVVASHLRLSPEKNRPWRFVFDLKPVDPMAFRQAINSVYTGGGTPLTATKGTAKETTELNALALPEKLTPDEVINNTAPKTTLTAPSIVKKKLIIIDPGHGGVDPGALAGSGLREKNVTLATAKEVKRILEQSGKYRVKMTRDTDVYIKLPDRVKIARAAQADLFISLHADTIGRPTVQGASVYTLSDTASDVETAKLAARENAVDSLVNVDVGPVDADVEDILVDLVTRDNMNQSKVLAETVVDTFHAKGVSTLPQRPHRSAGFAVLKAPDIPSVLIEMGYLSNKQEAAKLASTAHREKIARAVVDVIERYFTQTSKQASY